MPSLGSLAKPARLAGGAVLGLIGVALLVLPGPGVPVIIAGLALWARDLPWAARLVAWLRARLTASLQWARGRA